MQYEKQFDEMMMKIFEQHTYIYLDFTFFNSDTISVTDKGLLFVPYKEKDCVLDYFKRNGLSVTHVPKSTRYMVSCVL